MKSLERVSQHSFLPQLVRKDSLTLDLGGNRGEFSRVVRDRYGWNVLPVEPNPDLANHLRALGFNVVEAAVTGTDGTTTFTFDSTKELTGSVLGMEIVGSLLNDEDSRKQIEVPTFSLSTLLKQQNQPVDLIKVDIEGAELNMFMEADDKTLLSVQQFTVEFHDYWYPELSGKTEIVKNRLKNLGFWQMRAGPNNKDILFVNPNQNLPPLKRFYVGFLLRNFNGLGRAVRVFSKRFLGLS